MQQRIGEHRAHQAVTVDGPVRAHEHQGGPLDARDAGHPQPTSLFGQLVRL